MARTKRAGKVPAHFRGANAGTPLANPEATFLRDCRPNHDGVAEFASTPFDCIRALAAWADGAPAPDVEDLWPLAVACRDALAGTAQDSKTEEVVDAFLRKIGFRADAPDDSALASEGARARQHVRVGAVLALMRRDKIGRDRAIRAAAETYPELGSERQFRRALEAYSKVYNGLHDPFLEGERDALIDAHWQRFPLP